MSRCRQVHSMAQEVEDLKARLAAQPAPAMSADVEALRSEVHVHALSVG